MGDTIIGFQWSSPTKQPFPIAFRFAQLRTEQLIGERPQFEPREYVDSIMFGVQLGWEVWPQKSWYLIVGLHGLFGVKEDFYTRNELVASFQWIFPVAKHWSLDINFSPMLWGRNASQTFSMSFGVSFSR